MASDPSPTLVLNVTVNVYAFDTVLGYVTQMEPAGDIITTATLCLLLVLASAALYLLMQGVGRLEIKMLIASVTTLYACAWAYCALTAARYIIDRNIIAAFARKVFSTDNTLVTVESSVVSIKRIDFASTMMFTIAMIISDAVVWWRACAVWPGNRIVLALCVVSILASCAMGLASVAVSTLVQDQVLYFFGNNYGTAAVTLSLGTNVVATSLIGYKAWKHWRALRTHLRDGKSARRVLRILALLVESGAAYSILLLLISVWQGHQSMVQAGKATYAHWPLWLALDYLLTGCLAPLIATYPILIVVLVSLDLSLQHGLNATQPQHKLEHTPYSSLSRTPRSPPLLPTLASSDFGTLRRDSLMKFAQEEMENVDVIWIRRRSHEGDGHDGGDGTVEHEAREV
ncbi:uncharacterized protein BXZ73DRAFT_103828 [Epithele typhae]|uniref:uncharacterized protein n=1 Tax=Epithele typhae TaxID=378194 RepID=UPI00200780A5|nr:uncharacterized protein BXZ73DRAFT_103828 [Epithele typhae]KAH9923780.1 hypothetical protein BXZ73DRAFT_103828 [Epithele typhae]